MDFSQIAFVSTAVKIIAFTPKSLFAALQELVPHISTWGCSTHLHESCKLQVQFSRSEREARLASHLNVGRACARVGRTKLDSLPTASVLLWNMPPESCRKHVFCPYQPYKFLPDLQTIMLHHLPLTLLLSAAALPSSSAFLASSSISRGLHRHRRRAMQSPHNKTNNNPSPLTKWNPSNNVSLPSKNNHPKSYLHCMSLISSPSQSVRAPLPPCR